MKNFVLLSLLILCLSCQKSTHQSQQEVIQIDEKFTAVPEAYYFYTIGDWGRGGELGQAELAQAMGQAAGKVEPEFIVSTGDNFYPNGVASTSDPQWMSSFENVYSTHSLNCDWYVVLGNHDYRGNPQAEIDYSEVSRRWNMPARYFHKDITTDEGASVRFVFADTSPLNDDYYQEEKYQNKVAGQDTTAQMMWLDSMLSADFDWKIVVGHHPLYTGGKRVDEPNAVRTHLEPLLEKHKVNLYLAGHEHDLQHIKPENYKTHHFVSGAGSDLRPVGEIPETQFAASVNGFLSVAITSESLLCQFVDAKGQVIYETTITQ